MRLTALLLLFFTFSANASLKIAVASNFRVTLSEIVALYKQQSEQKILISSGSTGILYNQITHGAPFDLFLSADSERAKLIELSKLGVDGSRFTYAQGQLAFWYPRSSEAVNQKQLHNFKGRVAIANPKLAPYGLATKQSLQTLKKWSQLSFIKGNNVTQAYQFVDTGNVKAGFVAYALIVQNRESNFYLLPTDSYQPILQQGVMLSGSTNSAELQKFVKFLQSDSIQSLIRSRGYL
ncbi:MAG: molybdate ABC transporter substrate-binding protein [Psychromonas sp.]|nr:molybdate ABC transporter substrate-binding protein [Alteromonadales bacterium]MCP5076996.1 molybdate ABC transporter substrate-binding protein [Psychromonas sp.]